MSNKFTIFLHDIIKQSYSPLIAMILVGNLMASVENNHYQERIKKYKSITNLFERMNKTDLMHRLSQATKNHTGIGGESFILHLQNNQKVFVKKIPLTALELKAENKQSTQNIFQLPLYYQYGVGSTGFGAWRELKAHQMTTDWVLANKCHNFPILYHWIIVPKAQADPMLKEQKDGLFQAVAYWNNNEKIHNRLQMIYDADSEVVLFLEYIPNNLRKWAFNAFKSGETKANAAIKLINQQLKETTEFMQNNGFIHFDAHFQNLLSDGHLVYFSDFGLSLSDEFNLTPEEQQFFNEHKNYDRVSLSLYMIYTVIRHYYGKEKWDDVLTAAHSGRLQDIKLLTNDKKLPDGVASLLIQHAGLAKEIGGFFNTLQTKSKLTKYPKNKLNKMFQEIQHE